MSFGRYIDVIKDATISGYFSTPEGVLEQNSWGTLA